MNNTLRIVLIAAAAVAGGLTATTPAGAEPGPIAPVSWSVVPPDLDARSPFAAPHPDVAQQGRLEAALVRYQAIAKAGGLPRVPGDQVLRQGDMAFAVLDLRRHLTVTGDLAVDTPTILPRFTKALRKALERYQARHGLAVDGVFGPETAGAMNVPVDERIATLERNIDRLRDAERHAAPRRIEVNVAAQELRYWRDGALVHRARVVVGQPGWKTPRFSDRLEFVVLNPSWTVTRRIAAADILPKLREDPGYLARKNMVLFADWNASATVNPYAVDWSSVDGRTMPYMIRQQPGPDNALGQVKFLFPNEHAVYLHDTPSKRLFEKPVRAFSHGCMRLEDPMAFAKRLLADVNGMAPEAVDRRVASRQTDHIRLEEPVAIDIVYRTAWVDEAGTLHFRPDIYDLDRAPAEQPATPAEIAEAAGKRPDAG